MHHKDCFWKTFGIERVNESQKLLNSAEKYFFPTFSSFWGKLSLEKLFLIRSEILALLVNTLNGNYEYSPSNRENLQLQIQIKLSQEPQTFLLYFLLIFWIYIKLPTFLNRDERLRSNISQVIDSERCGYLNA